MEEKGKLKAEHLEEALEYIKSKECFQSSKKNAIIQVVAYLNHKYPNTITTVDLEREVINIKGEDRELILKDLEGIGLLH